MCSAEVWWLGTQQGPRAGAMRERATRSSRWAAGAGAGQSVEMLQASLGRTRQFGALHHGTGPRRVQRASKALLGWVPVSLAPWLPAAASTGSASGHGAHLAKKILSSRPLPSPHALATCLRGPPSSGSSPHLPGRQSVSLGASSSSKHHRSSLGVTTRWSARAFEISSPPPLRLCSPLFSLPKSLPHNYCATTQRTRCCTVIRHYQTRLHTQTSPRPGAAAGLSPRA